VVQRLILANKCDLFKSRCIGEEQGREFATQNGCGYWEVSAKEGLNIEEAFKHLLDLLKAEDNSIQASRAKTKRKNSLDLDLERVATPEHRLLKSQTTRNQDAFFGTKTEQFQQNTKSLYFRSELTFRTTLPNDTKSTMP
jgi:GTPase SAR1 family protein